MSISKQVGLKIVSGFVSLSVAWMITEFVLHLIFPTYVEIKIDNRSGEQLELIEVSAYQKNQQIHRLVDGESSTLKFKSNGKSYYSIKMQFDSEKIITTRFSYLEGNTYDHITIQHDDFVHDETRFGTDSKTTSLKWLFIFFIMIPVYRTLSRKALDQLSATEKPPTVLS